MPVQTICLPDFIIVGANKAGTTSVATYLNEHPDICMSRVKEPMFFVSAPRRAVPTQLDATLDNPYFALSLDEYSSLFDYDASNFTVFGEASTAYLASPSEAAGIIKKILPRVKIIAILRHPVERAISAYKMCVGNSIEKRAFSEIVENARNEKTILRRHGVTEYVRNGLYSQLLAPYFDFFVPDQVLLLNYDALGEQPQTFMDALYRFLGVSPVKGKFTKRYNTESEHLKKQITVTLEQRKELLNVFYDDILALASVFDIDDWLKRYD